MCEENLEGPCGGREKKKHVSDVDKEGWVETRGNKDTAGNHGTLLAAAAGDADAGDGRQEGRRSQGPAAGSAPELGSQRREDGAEVVREAGLVGKVVTWGVGRSNAFDGSSCFFLLCVLGSYGTSVSRL